MKRYIVFILACLPLLITTRLLWLKSPPVWSDEAIFVDVAKHIITDGRPTTDLYGPLISGLFHAQIAYPPAYFYLLSAWIGLFGSSINAVRLLSMCIGLGVLAVWYMLLLKGTKRILWAGVGTLVLASEPKFQAASRMGRMDILVLFFILLSLWIYTSANNRKLFVFISGIIATMAVLTHPMGFLAPSLIVLGVLRQKIGNKLKLQHLALIVLPLVFGVSTWISTQIPSWRVFVEQLIIQAARKNVLTAYLPIYIQQSPMNTLLYLYMSFIVLTTFFIGLFKRNAPIIFFGIVTFVVALIVLIAKEQWYLIYLQPLFIYHIILSSRYMRLKNELSKYFAIALISIPLICYVYSFVVNLKNTSNDNYARFTRELITKLPTKGTICMSALPDPYFSLQNDRQWRLREFLYTPTLLAEKIAFLNECDALVINSSPGESTIHYMEENSLSQSSVGNPDGYNTLVVLFKPRNERK